MKYLFPMSLLIIFLFSCQSKTTILKEDQYIKTIEKWHEDRAAELTSGHSWLALAGLYRLKEGKNDFGSAASNSIIFPDRAAPLMGSFYVDGNEVNMVVREEVDIINGDLPVKLASMKADSNGNVPIFHYKSLNWNLIERGGQYLVRLRDTINPAIQTFSSIDRFKIDEHWKLEARYKTFDAPKVITIRNVLGMDIEQTIEGYIEFEIAGKTYTLDPLDGGPEDFFIIFADETTGDSTYGGGRYLYIPRPKADNKTVIDFNKAHNPPCAFTDYATCLLPTAANKLAVEITAGEKNYGAH